MKRRINVVWNLCRDFYKVYFSKKIENKCKTFKTNPNYDYSMLWHDISIYRYMILHLIFTFIGAILLLSLPIIIILKFALKVI